MAGYIVSGAGTVAANGVYADRGTAVNGEPSYANGLGWYLFYARFDIMAPFPETHYTWVIMDTVASIISDPGFDAAYHKTPFEQSLPAGDTWNASYNPQGTGGVAPAPSVAAYDAADDPTDPGDEPEPGDEPGVVDEVPFVLLGEAGYGLRVLGAGDYAALLAEGSVGVRRVAVRRTLGV